MVVFGAILFTEQEMSTRRKFQTSLPRPTYRAAPLHWDSSRAIELSFQFL